METVTIEFEANEQQDWFFHCHILYHMMAGMARIVSYEGSEQNEFAKTVCDFNAGCGFLRVFVFE